MVETIFDNKVIEKNDMRNKMRFPVDAKISYLPPACCSGGQRLPVKDEKGTEWKLTCEKQIGKIYFTDGWKEFREGRGIRDGHKISFYKADDSGTGAQYKIKVKKN